MRDISALLNCVKIGKNYKLNRIFKRTESLFSHENAVLTFDFKNKAIGTYTM